MEHSVSKTYTRRQLIPYLHQILKASTKNSKRRSSTKENVRMRISICISCWHIWWKHNKSMLNFMKKSLQWAKVTITPSVYFWWIFRTLLWRGKVINSSKGQQAISRAGSERTNIGADRLREVWVKQTRWALPALLISFMLYYCTWVVRDDYYWESLFFEVDGISETHGSTYIDNGNAVWTWYQYSYRKSYTALLIYSYST